MRIVINDIAASSGGALTILKNLHNFIIHDNDAKKHEWIFLLCDKHINESKNIKVIVRKDIKKSWFNRLKFEFFSGRKFIMALNPDIVLSLQNTITYGLSCPQVVYMHQSIPFQNIKKFSFFKSSESVLAVYQYIIGSLIKQSIKKSDFTIVQTEWIREAVLKATKISPNKITNILPPIENYSFLPMNTNSYKHNCFFYPANDSVYKNHNCLYEAVRILRENNTSNFEVLLTLDKKNKDERNINYLGTMNFDSVLKQYSNSILVYPSYIETIGLPLLEARQMGSLILASDTPFSREALEGYENAYYFDPFKPEELASLMSKVINKEIVKKLINENNKVFPSSWKKLQDILEMTYNGQR